ncbi:MAG: DUF1398 family protein [Phycisphaerales bacterium]
MNAEQVMVIHDTVRGSLTGSMTFPQIVGELAAIGVERYHADYNRCEITYYFSDGGSLVMTVPWGEHTIARDFSAVAVESAVRQSQRGEHTFLDFVRKTTAVGCVGYVVQITGRCVQYYGRNGEMHVERFPT